MKDTNILIRISSERKDNWVEKANAMGLTLSAYIIYIIDNTEGAGDKSAKEYKSYFK